MADEEDGDDNHEDDGEVRLPPPGLARADVGVPAVHYITLQYSTVPASGSHYNQEGNYPDTYININISTSTYKFIHER